MEKEIKDYFKNSKFEAKDGSYYDIHLIEENIDIHIKTKKLDDMGWFEVCVDACDSSSLYCDKVSFINFKSSFKSGIDSEFELPTDYLMSIIKSIVAIHRIPWDKDATQGYPLIKYNKVRYDVATEKSNNTFIIFDKFSKTDAPLFFGGFINPDGCKWTVSMPCKFTNLRTKDAEHRYIDLHGNINSDDFAQQVADYLYKDNSYNLDDILKSEYEKAKILGAGV